MRASLRPLLIKSSLLSVLFSSAPASQVFAQSNDDEEKLFQDEFSEEKFFKLEEEAVTIASKHAQSTREAPATVTVITAEDINRYGFRDMGDLLRAVAGWYVSNGYDYLYAGNRGVMLRGDQNSRVLILIDGHTQNEAWSSSSSIDEGLGLDMSAISRVEVLQGPSSTLYGSNAFLGIINIVTKSGEEVGKAQASLELGSFGYTRLSLASGKKTGSVTYHARLTGALASGRSLYFPDRAQTSPTAGYTPADADALRNVGAFAEIQLKDVRIMGEFVDRNKNVPTAPYNTVLGSSDTRYDGKRFFLEARYSKSAKSGVDVMARTYYDGYRFQDSLRTYDEVQPSDPNEGIATYLFRDTAAVDQFGAEAQLGFSVVNTPTLTDQLYVGIEGGYVSTLSEAYVVNESTPEALPSDAVKVPVSTTIAGAYLQNELQYNQRINFVAGLRFDYNQNFFRPADALQTLSPRGALIVRTKNDSTFKLMYARGFRYPSIYEAFFDDGTDITSNLNLKPESIHNLEFAYEYRLKNTLRLGLATYYFVADNLLRQQTICLDNGGSSAIDENCQEVRQQFQNVAQVEGQGSELTVEARLPAGLQTRGTIALQRATDRQANRPLINSPGVIFNAMASYPLMKDKAFLSTQLHVVSGRTTAADPDAEVVNVPPYALLNLVFSSQALAPNLHLSAGVYNVLDWRSEDVAVAEEIVVDQSDTPVLTIPTDGRTFELKLSYRFCSSATDCHWQRLKLASLLGVH